jgi:hypothetical protein
MKYDGVHHSRRQNGRSSRACAIRHIAGAKPGAHHYILGIDSFFNAKEPTMNALTSTTFKLTTLALSAAMTLSLTGAVIQSFQPQMDTTTVVQLPTVVIIGHRDVVTVTDTLQADAKPVAKSAVKSGA